MCAEEIADLVVAGANVWADGKPLTPETIAREYLAKNFPFLIDVSSVDDDDVTGPPASRLKELEGVEYTKDAETIVVENFDNYDFEEIHTMMYPASDFPALGHEEKWADIRTNIVSATQEFEAGLGKLDLGMQQGQDGLWRGKTHDAAINNVTASLAEPQTVAAGAGVMSILADAFMNTIWATKQNIVRNGDSGLRWNQYQTDLSNWPEFTDRIKNEYTTFARKAMREVYAPTISQIAENNPAFTAGATPPVGPQLPGGPPGGPTGTTGGGVPGGGPGPLGMPKSNLGSLDKPKIPDFTRPTIPDVPKTPTIPTPTTPPGLGGLTDPVRAASDAARNALGQAADAAKQAAQAAQNPNGAGKGPPEGVLGLGPKGLGGSPSAGGAGGKTGAGAGAGPLRGLAGGKAVGTPVAAARLATPASAAGAGLGAMGPPGAGAPAAGQRGGDNAKGHQLPKVLRRKKTGQQIAGEAEAVVPVIGAPDKPPKPEEAQSDPPSQSERLGGGMPSVAERTDRTSQPIHVPGQ